MSLQNQTYPLMNSKTISIYSFNIHYSHSLDLRNRMKLLVIQSAFLSFSWAGVKSVCPLIQVFLSNYSRICLHTKYSHPSLGECFKTKTVLTYRTHLLPCSKMPKNGCSLSIVVSYTNGKPMERGLQIVNVPNTYCPTQKSVLSPEMSKNGC